LQQAIHFHISRIRARTASGGGNWEPFQLEHFEPDSAIQTVGKNIATNNTKSEATSNEQQRDGATQSLRKGQKGRLRICLYSIRVIRVIRGCFFSGSV
jgi:hypothetical protein